MNTTQPDAATDQMVVCDMCYTGDVIVAGNITDTIGVVAIDGVWQLMVEPAHKGDTLVTFDTPPRPDPYAGLDDNDIPDDEDLDPDWTVDAMSAMSDINMSLTAAVNFAKEVEAAGWEQSRDGYVELWLYHRAGELIAALGEQPAA